MIFCFFPLHFQFLPSFSIFPHLLHIFHFLSFFLASFFQISWQKVLGGGNVPLLPRRLLCHCVHCPNMPVMPNFHALGYIVTRYLARVPAIKGHRARIWHKARMDWRKSPGWLKQFKEFLFVFLFCFVSVCCLFFVCFCFCVLFFFFSTLHATVYLYTLMDLQCRKPLNLPLQRRIFVFSCLFWSWCHKSRFFDHYVLHLAHTAHVESKTTHLLQLSTLCLMHAPNVKSNFKANVDDFL